jgi:hypothetical protein
MWTPARARAGLQRLGLERKGNWTAPNSGSERPSGPRGGGEGTASGADGLEARSEIESVFFFFFQFFKRISNRFCISLLYFQKVHTIQNIMQQHEYSIMFLPLYLILN